MAAFFPTTRITRAVPWSLTPRPLPGTSVKSCATIYAQQFKCLAQSGQLVFGRCSCIVIPPHHADSLRNIISPYVLDSMRHKLRATNSI